MAGASLAAATVKFQQSLFRMRDRTVGHDVGTVDPSLVMGIKHLCGHALMHRKYLRATTT